MALLWREECKVRQGLQPDGPVPDDPRGWTAREHEPATSARRRPLNADAAERKDFDMPQMFDWIFFAIVGLPTAYIVWDWLRDR